MEPDPDVARHCFGAVPGNAQDVPAGARTSRPTFSSRLAGADKLGSQPNVDKSYRTAWQKFAAGVVV